MGAMYRDLQDFDKIWGLYLKLNRIMPALIINLDFLKVFAVCSKRKQVFAFLGKTMLQYWLVSPIFGSKNILRVVFWCSSQNFILILIKDKNKRYIFDGRRNWEIRIATVLFWFTLNKLKTFLNYFNKEKYEYKTHFWTN